MAAAMAQTRRRRRGGGGQCETELAAAPAAPSPAPADDDDAASGSVSDDEDAAVRTGRGGGRGSRRSALSLPTLSRPSRPSLTRDTSTRTNLRAQQRVPDYHRPSALARLAASLRAFVYGTQDHYFLSRYQVAASTPLQMALYFNVPYAFVFAGVNQLVFYWKSTTWDLPIVVAVVSPMVFWVWALLEPIRLLLGYVGNLRERVAWLGGFWVLTIFPQIVVHIYFIFGQALIGWFTLPIEIAMSVIYAAVLLFQLLVGYGTIKRLIAKAMADFHLQPVESDEASTHL